ncbi:MAG: hypothetical protein LBN11_01405 [Tannerella sp.]|jgi:hypothetical protein|nr:hypothetical protein [Tannerella sp.]
MILKWKKAIEQSVVVAHRDVFRAFKHVFINDLPPPPQITVLHLYDHNIYTTVSPQEPLCQLHQRSLHSGFFVCTD